MKIRVRIKRKNLEEPLLPLPAYKRKGDSGMDLRSAAPTFTLAPGKRTRVPCGFAFQIPEGYEGQLRPRSGCADDGLIVVQATIDRNYRGEVGIQLKNHGEKPVTIERGDRIAQVIFAPVAEAELEEVTELEPSERGEDGYGSTGRK